MASCNCVSLPNKDPVLQLTAEMPRTRDEDTPNTQKQKIDTINFVVQSSESGVKSKKMTRTHVGRTKGLMTGDENGHSFPLDIPYSNPSLQIDYRDSRSREAPEELDRVRDSRLLGTPREVVPKKILSHWSEVNANYLIPYLCRGWYNLLFNVPLALTLYSTANVQKSARVSNTHPVLCRLVILRYVVTCAQAR